MVLRLDRLGRSLKHQIEVVSALQERGVGLKSQQESIDTTTSGGKLIFHVLGAVAEFEHALIQARTKAGLEAARARGRRGGRPLKLSEAKTDLLYRLHDERENTVAEICSMVGISKPALNAYLARRDDSNAGPRNRKIAGSTTSHNAQLEGAGHTDPLLRRFGGAAGEWRRYR